ncbi:hypothetical protein C8T65DRAFT_134925 [Cerioporus squamosus]|nr:hypothetical protein C8T65DRAFT_134925 [Cerioporus squamosus]
MSCSTRRAVIQDRHVHERITFHAAELLRLKQLYNTHSPISKLPPELLSLIFALQARAFYDEVIVQWGKYRYGEPSHRPIYSWIAVSQVSRQWRKVALDCAKLWTTVVLDERVAPELVRTVVTRSCGLPLNVVLNASEELHCTGGCAFKKEPEDCYSAAISILEEILPRTVALTLFIDIPNHSNVWDALASLDTSAKLEDLRIEAVGWQPYSLRRGAGVMVPGELSSEPLSVLHRLRLRNVRLEWSSTLFCSSLRSIHLSKCLYGYESHLGDMLTALRGMACLESMDFDSVPPSLPDNEYEPVPMPHLQQVRVPADELGALLVSHLIPPSSACVRFFDVGESYQYYKKDSVQDVPDTVLLRMRAAVDHLLKGMVAYAIAYECRDGRRRRYNSYSVCRIWAAEDHCHKLDIPGSWAAIEGRPCRIAFDSSTLHGPLLAKTLSATDLRHVHTINYRDIDCDGARVSMETLRGAENLSTLRMSGEATFAMNAVLSGWTRPSSMDEETRKQIARGAAHKRCLPPDWIGLGDLVEDEQLVPRLEGSDAPSNRPHDTNGSRPLFPHLRTLSFFQVDLSLREGDKGYMFKDDVSRVFWWRYSPPYYGLDVKGVVECLRRRVAQGASPIESLNFDTCQCREREQLIPLVHAVDEVRWDGEVLRVEDLVANADLL